MFYRETQFRSFTIESHHSFRLKIPLAINFSDTLSIQFSRALKIIMNIDFSPQSVLYFTLRLSDINNIWNPVDNLMWSRGHKLTYLIGYTKARQNRKGLIFCKHTKTKIDQDNFKKLRDCQILPRPTNKNRRTIKKCLIPAMLYILALCCNVVCNCKVLNTIYRGTRDKMFELVECSLVLLTVSTICILLLRLESLSKICQQSRDNLRTFDNAQCHFKSLHSRNHGYVTPQ